MVDALSLTWIDCLGIDSTRTMSTSILTTSRVVTWTTSRLLALTVALWGGACFGQEKPEDSAEEQALMASARAYQAAYEKGDAKALAAFFTDEAEYLAEDGRTVRGRAQIEESLRAALRSRGKSTLTIQTDSVRKLAPEVLLEKGRTSVTGEDGQTGGSQFTAVHVKADGKWLISNLVETPLPLVSPAERLSELNWLIGKWSETDKGNDLTVESEYQWARGGNFISCTIIVTKGGELTLEGWQIIGWDPLDDEIRSWTFDSEGGLAEARWTGGGDRWLVRDAGVAADGTRTTADNTITRISDDQFTWESHNRLLGGDPQPSIGQIEVNRVKGQ